MRTDVRFDAGGVELAGWLYVPEGNTKPHPLVVMSHGFSAVRRMGLDDYAQVFVQAGLACLVYDHRGFAESEGEPRHEIDAWQQIHDMRDAISYARTLPEIDGERIGIWGTSYAGSHVIVVGAIDRRVKCVVSQVPLMSGSRTLPRWVPAAKLAGLRDAFDRDRDAQARGEPPQVVTASPKGSDAATWAEAIDQEGAYPNEVTLRSMELLTEYEPELYIHRMGPTPFLMIASTQDITTPTEEQLVAYSRATEPKRLVLIDGGHYDPYIAKIDEASAAARDWFLEHLTNQKWVVRGVSPTLEGSH